MRETCRQNARALSHKLAAGREHLYDRPVRITRCPRCLAEDITAELADAHDDAVLDMVAAEMAAPDVSDVDDPYDADMDEFAVAELPATNHESVAQAPEPILVPEEPQAFQPSLQPSEEVSVEPSLGSALIANGILRKPGPSGSDPLAPIRRMSQAEKIAFFS